MRRLVDAGWSPATAARAVLERDLLASIPPRPSGTAGSPAGILEAFLDGAARMDPHATRTALDHGMSLGSFEHAVDTWLFPALIALGEGWARGEIDVAGEHMA